MQDSCRRFFNHGGDACPFGDVQGKLCAQLNGNEHDIETAYGTSFTDYADLQPLRDYVAGVQQRNVLYVIAKERSDCGNLNYYSRRIVYSVRSEAEGAIVGR